MRRVLVGFVAAATMAALAGCGLGGSDSGDGKTDTSGEIKGKVSLQTWALKPKFTTYVQGVIDAFQKKYPGTQVEWLDQPGDGYSDKVLSQASAGSLPDVTNLPPDFALPLAKQGMLLDVGKADPKLAADYVEGGIAAYRYAGVEGVYGYPWYLNTDVNYWNKELLAQNGLDAAKPPTTLDELIAQATVMKERSGGKVYLMSRKPGLGDLANAGVKLMAADGKSFTFNTPEAAALLDKYRDAYKEKLLPQDVLSDKYQGNSKLFSTGVAAWTTGGGNYITSLATDNPTLAPKVVPSKAMGTPPLYVQGLSVSKKSKNLSTAIALARWVTNAENQAAFAHLVNIFPSTKASANDPFFSKSDGTPSGDAKVLAFTSLAQAQQLSPVEVSGAMSTIVDQQFGLAISGAATSKQALDDAVAKCDQLLKG
ncbi:solute-binding protein [Longispora fulva]|uniref:Multiple sugar transport system substrate-binding protein n=1 Tax=Longispora fulva TaxID=619741 RepID=A0A8J7GHG0_9ACTN|nr:extracellular solute-binding protein [Longispora fulva]MBG6136970.1 multiple sugar transport system substrate-binding protein [Longispora fulva]GIG61677.1 solute-binding protein [Longispora fulva]